MTKVFGWIGKNWFTRLGLLVVFGIALCVMSCTANTVKFEGKQPSWAGESMQKAYNIGMSFEGKQPSWAVETFQKYAQDIK